MSQASVRSLLDPRVVLYEEPAGQHLNLVTFTQSKASKADDYNKVGISAGRSRHIVDGTTPHFYS